MIPVSNAGMNLFGWEKKFVQKSKVKVFATQDRQTPHRGFQTRTVYLNYVTCLRYTLLVQNPGYVTHNNKKSFKTLTQVTCTERSLTVYRCSQRGRWA